MQKILNFFVCQKHEVCGKTSVQDRLGECDCMCACVCALV